MASQTVLWPPAGCMSRVSRLVQLPAAHAPLIRTAAFSTTARQCKRKTKDSNKKRGVSSLYRSGPRQHLSMSDVPLPKPRDFKPEVAVDQDHGLWGFFPAQGKLLETPQEVMAHGRAWAVEELRRKSWEDLHSLWWVCCRERNMLATSKAELLRAKLGYGEREYEERDLEVRKTMQRIKHTLTERFYLWQDTKELASSDPEIDMEAEDRSIYEPSSEDEGSNGWTAPGQGGGSTATASQPSMPDKETTP